MVELYQTRLRGIQHRRFQKVSQVYNNARRSLRFVYRKKPKRNNRRIRRSIGLLSDLNANLQRRRPNSKSFLVDNLRSNKSNQQHDCVPQRRRWRQIWLLIHAFLFEMAERRLNLEANQGLYFNKRHRDCFEATMAGAYRGKWHRRHLIPSRHLRRWSLVCICRLVHGCRIFWIS